MALSRRLARPLLASIFVVGGWDAFWHPEGKVKKAVAVTDPLAEKAGVEGLDAVMLVRVNGAVQIAGGVLLAVGRFRRTAAVALIGSIIPTTYAGHRFWEEEDETTRKQQQVHFLKNLGLLGGLILAAADTEGEPSLGWRARRRAARIGAAVSVGRAASSTSAGSAVDSAAGLARHAQEAAAELGRHLDDGASRASRHAQDVAGRAARHTDTTGRHLAAALPGTGDALASALTGAGLCAADTASRAAHTGSEALAPYLAAGTERAGDLVERVHAVLDR